MATATATATPVEVEVQGSLLQAAVQSVHWTYSLFWRFSTRQRMLVWGDGYYNGPIKTRKTLHPTELTTEEASLHRSHQLRDLYDSLSAGDRDAHPLRRPCASLSPEDLTESEWFYLLCISFSFPPGLGLPGKAYAKKQHVWITGANEIDSKTFSRAILAKSARIKTVVCIPLMDGVVELGTTDKVKEDIGFIQHIKSIFEETTHSLPLRPRRRPRPAFSELSTSNSATPFEHYNHLYSSAAINRKEEDEMDSAAESDSDTETSNNAGCPSSNVAVAVGGEPSELMQLELSEDIRLGSPDDASNNFDAHFHLLPMPHSVSGNAEDFHLLPDSHKNEYHPTLKEPCNTELQPPPPGNSPAAVAVVTEEDTHYSNTVSAILQNQSSRRPDSSSVGNVTCSFQSAFSKWTRRSDLHCVAIESTGTSQCSLKHILLNVPFLHTKHRDENPSRSKSCDGRWLKGTSQDELSRNHFLAEKCRRENLNDKFIILRSIVPFVTKMDKASILGDAVEYLKQLRKKIQDLEAQNRELESDRRYSFEELRRNAAAHQTRYDQPCLDTRKLRILEGVGDGCIKHKVLKSPPRLPSPTSVDTNLQVSIIGSDGLLELQCPYKEGLLLDILLILQRLRIETTAVRSSLSNGVFIAELRAKVKENMDGKKASILEVKRAIQQIIPRIDT